MAYDPLPIEEVDLDDLQLDLDNYRIPTRSSSEAAALKYLFASEDVVGAARLILQAGYFDNEVPIVTPDGAAPSNFVVLEGNRRISALKALHDPTVVPSHEDQIRGLLKRYATEAEDLPVAVRVLVSPDRARAAPHIARLHTGQSKRAWSRDQQATFYYSLLDASTTVEDLKADYPGVDVPRFIRMAVTRRFLANVKFDDKSLNAYASSDDLKMSSFEYAYRNRSIASAIGIEFAPSGELIPLSSAAEHIAHQLSESQRKALERLMMKFRSGALNTRSPAFKKGSKEQENLLAEITGTPAPSPTDPIPPTVPSAGGVAVPPAPGPPAPTDFTPPPSHPGPQPPGAPASSPSVPAPTPSSAPTSPPSGPASRGPNRPSTRTKLEFGSVDYASAPVNLQYRYIELRSIDVMKFPAATAMLLRSVLETTIKCHYENTASPVSGELARIFPSVVSDYGKEKHLKASISYIQSGSAQKPGSIQWFNLMAHSADAVVSGSDVHEAWRHLNPIIRHLLRSIAPTP